jgi:hypothetical protein
MEEFNKTIPVVSFGGDVSNPTVHHDYSQGLISPLGDESEAPIRKVSPIEYPKGFKSLLVPGKTVLLEGEVLELYQVKKLRKNNTAPRYWFKGIGILAVKEPWEE